MIESNCNGFVMVVDDDAGIRESISEVLTDHEYRAIEAANGREAIQRLRLERAKPCVILLDIMMPEMDGWQFRAAQKEDPELSKIPVIVLSAHANLTDVVAGLEASAGLKKPVQLETLLTTVERICRAGTGAT
jgi:CheY-like chemotaxis protein